MHPVVIIITFLTQSAPLISPLNIIQMINELLSQSCFVSIVSSIACPPGSYKDKVGNEDSCNVCPANSNSTSPGSAICTCAEGYYRTLTERADYPCTGQKEIKQDQVDIFVERLGQI